MSVNQSILNDIQAEELCSNPDKNHIQRCKDAIDNLSDLTHDEFVNTGHIMPVEQIKDRYPHIRLREDAKSVCRYAGGFCIQFIGTNKFFWNYHEDVDFKHVESTLFNHVKNLINEQS